MLLLTMRPSVLLLLASLIRLSHSKEVICTTKQTQKGMCYIIPGTTASGCSYSWSNKSDHNLVVDREKIDHLVDFSNITVLVTYNCYETIIYTRSCHSEGKTTGTCFVNCTTASHQGTSDPSGNHWWVSVIVIVCGLLLVAVTLVLYRRCRRHPHAPVNGNDLDNNV